MRYKLIDALSFLKKEIERLEKRMEEEQDNLCRKELESIMEWNFEKALGMLRFAKEYGEKIDQKTLDWFLGRKEIRPDLEKIDELIKKGRSRDWLQRIWDNLTRWWLK